MSWKCHVDHKNNIRYYMILSRYLLTALGMDLDFSENLVIGDEGPYEGCLSNMAELSNYDFKYLTENTVKPEESFVHSYVDECLKAECSISSTCRMHRILDAKNIKL